MGLRNFPKLDLMEMWNLQTGIRPAAPVDESNLPYFLFRLNLFKKPATWSVNVFASIGFVR